MINRRNLLSRLGIGAAVAAVLPIIVKSAVEPKPIVTGWDMGADDRTIVGIMDPGHRHAIVDAGHTHLISLDGGMQSNHYVGERYNWIGCAVKG